MTFLPDSSAIVALLSAWHEGHEAAYLEFEQRLSAGERLVLAGPALLETYAVLTRLPAGARLEGDVTAKLLSGVVEQAAEIVTIDGAETVRLLSAAPARSVTGGRVYDGHIVACAVKAKAQSLLTFNERHFRALVPSSIHVIVPGREMGAPP